MGDIRKNYQYYLDNYSELVKKYDGKVLVIANQNVVAVCETEAEAHLIGKEKYGMGNFLIQRCSSEQKTYTVTFRNHVKMIGNETMHPSYGRI